MSQLSNGNCVFVEIRTEIHFLFTHCYSPPPLHTPLLHQSGKMEFIIHEEGDDDSHLDSSAPGGLDDGPNPAAEGPEGVGNNPSNVPSPPTGQKKEKKKPKPIKRKRNFWACLQNKGGKPAKSANNVSPAGSGRSKRRSTSGNYRYPPARD